MTVYAYFDTEPLPLTATTASAAAQNNNDNNKQHHAAENYDRNKKRGSVLSHLTGSSVGNVMSAGATFRQKMARAMSNNKVDLSSIPSVPPVEGAQVRASMTGSQAPATSTTTTQGKLVVVVIDNGPGISAENQKRLFKEVRCHVPNS